MTRESTHVKSFQSPGFTLLEVMICVAILSTGFVAVYSLHLQTLRSSYDIRFYTKAPMLAQKKLAEIIPELKDMSEDDGDFGDDFQGFAYNVSVSDVDENDILGDTAEKLKKINIKITFDEGVNTYGITAYRFVHIHDD